MESWSKNEGKNLEKGAHKRVEVKKKGESAIVWLLYIWLEV